MKLTLLGSAPSLNWKIPSMLLVHIPERNKLIRPVCDFEPDYLELASYGAVVATMGLCHVEPNENTEEAGRQRYG